jgi:Domain of unknown function (DUF4135)
LLDYAVETVTINFQNNIKLACERIRNDWNAIESVFFPGLAILHLSKIQTTGSDSHKGGKQVLILTFICDDNSKGRVVYKPSAVEIDCRIVGDSSIFKRVKPGGYSQEHSLTELINDFAQLTRKAEKRNFGYVPAALPTYKILPYNNASVPDAYGYIEFLTHEPSIPADSISDIAVDVEVVKDVAKLSADDVEKADWITSSDLDGVVFYHAWGGVMAMALAISLSDLHGQNIIVHRRLPHLIDLEDALKWPMESVEKTGLNSWFNRREVPRGQPFIVLNDGTVDMDVEWGPPEAGPAKGILYNQKSGGPVLLSGRGNVLNSHLAKALVQGFVEVIEILATPEYNKDVQDWVRGLDKTIARFVNVMTSDLLLYGRDLYRHYVEHRPPQPDHPHSYDELQVEFKKTEKDGTLTTVTDNIFREMVQKERKVWSDKPRAYRPQAWQRLPTFAIYHPDHAWLDYLNCDVPSFYHRLGSRDLLNSRGGVVEVDKAATWQDKNVQLPGRLARLGERVGKQYFPQSSVSLVTAQLERIRLRCATDEDMGKYLKEALAPFSRVNLKVLDEFFKDA